LSIADSRSKDSGISRCAEASIEKYYSNEEESSIQNPYHLVLRFIASTILKNTVFRIHCYGLMVLFKVKSNRSKLYGSCQLLIADENMNPIYVNAPMTCPSSEHIHGGIPIPKPIRVTTFSPAEWESFTQEWASSLKDVYIRVERYTGSGDQGVDIAGFISDRGWEGGWDNFQCKHYDHPLTPSDIWVEIGKIVYYSYKNEYPPPCKYYFIASRGLGTKLGKLLES
jgi:hypothetical protein